MSQIELERKTGISPATINAMYNEKLKESVWCIWKRFVRRWDVEWRICFNMYRMRNAVNIEQGRRVNEINKALFEGFIFFGEIMEWKRKKVWNKFKNTGRF